jgi:hypothetical protein
MLSRIEHLPEQRQRLVGIPREAQPPSSAGGDGAHRWRVAHRVAIEAWCDITTQ